GNTACACDFLAKGSALRRKSNVIPLESLSHEHVYCTATKIGAGSARIRDRRVPYQRGPAMLKGKSALVTGSTSALGSPLPARLRRTAPTSCSMESVIKPRSQKFPLQSKRNLASKHFFRQPT